MHDTNHDLQRGFFFCGTGMRMYETKEKSTKKNNMCTKNATLLGFISSVFEFFSTLSFSSSLLLLPCLFVHSPAPFKIAWNINAMNGIAEKWQKIADRRKKYCNVTNLRCLFLLLSIAVYRHAIQAKIWIIYCTYSDVRCNCVSWKCKSRPICI